MKKEVRVERKNELEEIKEALKIIQNYCKKYDTPYV